MDTVVITETPERVYSMCEAFVNEWMWRVESYISTTRQQHPSLPSCRKAQLAVLLTRALRCEVFLPTACDQRSMCAQVVSTYADVLVMCSRVRPIPSGVIGKLHDISLAVRARDEAIGKEEARRELAKRARAEAAQVRSSARRRRRDDDEQPDATVVTDLRNRLRAAQLTIKTLQEYGVSLYAELEAARSMSLLATNTTEAQHATTVAAVPQPPPALSIDFSIFDISPTSSECGTNPSSPPSTPGLFVGWQQ